MQVSQLTESCDRGHNPSFQAMESKFKAKMSGENAWHKRPALYERITDYLRKDWRLRDDPADVDLRPRFEKELRKLAFVYPDSEVAAPPNGGWRVVVNQGCPLQANYSDCGVLTMYMMRVLTQTPAGRMPHCALTGFDAVDILRVHFAIELARLRVRPLPRGNVGELAPQLEPATQESAGGGNAEGEPAWMSQPLEGDT